uniref:Cytochrome b n=1 Tax=Hanseniaspora uvarum TaxID=29833 RepID=Q2LMN0_HANUV|nr:apocytochrome b [Hanseniaspora uvarum]AAY46314.1 apocytochrome b [Hanseniaspora uvarum]
MSFRKSNIYLSLVNSYLIDSPQPSSISYWWNWGSLLGLSLVIQICTGLFLAMHYSSDTSLAFNTVEHIMRNVNNGWLIRFMHANGASFFFICLYAHIGKGIYYGSYQKPRQTVWIVGVIIFILVMATAFTGYCLVFGQMSLWGVTVITNLFSAITNKKKDIVHWLWGGFSVSNATIKRFFANHNKLQKNVAADEIMHMMALHTHGRSNPLGTSGNYDRDGMHGYTIFKDLNPNTTITNCIPHTVFFAPELLNHTDNNIMANPMSTPSSIVPEWYLLSFTTFLGSIPDKLMGVIVMFGAILVLLTLPSLDRSIIRGNAFKPLSKLLFWIFVCNFITLSMIGNCHVEEPYVTVGIICTIFYFAYFLVIIPAVSTLENVLFISSR